MKPDPIIEEVWRIKDELGRRYDYDIDRIFASLREAERRAGDAPTLPASDAEMLILREDPPPNR